MRLKDCHNFQDFRRLSQRRLPGPIFNYIDGGADDETTYRHNTRAFDQCDLLPSVLTGVSDVDMSVTVMGQKLAMPFYCSPTALQRLFHHEGERAVAAAAEKYGTMFGVSSLGTVSLEELRKKHKTPQVYQFYFHKDRGLNSAMMQRAKEAGVDVMMLTVDSITGGNRERDLRTGFSIPFRLTLAGMIQFAIKPMWGINYVTHERFRLPQLEEHVDMSGGASSIGGYFSEMLDPSMNWDDVAAMVRDWDGQFCLKGIMTVEDARRAAEIGCTGIVLSNHGGRQLDGSRAPFDQLAEIVDAVGDRIDVMMDSGIQRGTHVLKALSLGAKAVGVGRHYLYPLAAAGQAGVERALHLMRAEIERDMKLMGVTRIDQLNRDNLRFRNESREQQPIGRPAA
ncbi:alpha-hydroxy acid oxidase [Meridianimarinicoccus aquatilis]|uniref:Alpha-hydroxy-acid oxidizing protein n=1 Tax=Meridianimarinicoccus aquatilis TaxID=2552766 RepID=A0A4R6AT31_9RHOB|nr:alpha-hydroxy acid oxidase [Fluviibacterium aquatile]QIE42654.1 alpha-hydroxy-acid oxidizing protein [Rhodobacteraceae bacterium SC52]TDL85306.1 alpha-hydroxy-acid oxidizing protein [Fluviibacterium aquatile]